MRTAPLKRSWESALACSRCARSQPSTLPMDVLKCHIREGHDGKVHICGETEMLEGGKVRVSPIVKRPCWTYESFRQELTQALGRRAVGSSSVHDQSSRTHAVLELEIVCQSLVDARQAVTDRQSELVPVGKRATDITIEEQCKGLVALPGGGWAPNPDYKINQELIDAVEAEKSEHEARVVAAEELVDNILKSSTCPCLGAKTVFVDLAGAEYHQEKGAQLQLPRQTPQERQEGRQINTDLLALKEVMRAWYKNQPRIPFRSSALTMVLREHFLSSEKGNSTMIVTVSPAKKQYAAMQNSLKYGGLVGIASA
ncbi:P-loop containing nucleoside triphosphate hydrolase protein [Xylaria cf. heliscus]|nr:P-loop containing nucleoside triphosphate hydrolase protein [Xylaria cf. heliscus]